MARAARALAHALLARALLHVAVLAAVDDVTGQRGSRGGHLAAVLVILVADGPAAAVHAGGAVAVHASLGVHLLAALVWRNNFASLNGSRIHTYT